MRRSSRCIGTAQRTLGRFRVTERLARNDLYGSTFGRDRESVRETLWSWGILAAVVTLLATKPIAAAPPVWPQPEWPRATPRDLQLTPDELTAARDYAQSGGGSGFVIYQGHLVMSWGDPQQRYDLKSTTKSIGVTALGLAIHDGRMRLDATARRYHPRLGTPPAANQNTTWLDEISVLHLATHTAGFEKPGGYTPLVSRPGTEWAYSDGGPNWLAECVTLVYGRDVRDLLFERVFTPLSITSKDLTWRKNAYREADIEGVPRREFGSGIHANVDAMARIGYLYLHRGRWQDQQLLPQAFVDRVRTTVPEVVGLVERDPDTYGNASDHYGLLWWNNADGTLANVPRDAFWSWGLYDSLIVVIPSCDLVVARAGKSWKRQSSGHYAVLRPFFEPLVAATRPARGEAR
jgi:CubicO group peptidase (beta-lactamase class C family)